MFADRLVEGPDNSGRGRTCVIGKIKAGLPDGEREALSSMISIKDAQDRWLWTAKQIADAINSEPDIKIKVTNYMVSNHRNRCTCESL